MDKVFFSKDTLIRKEHFGTLILTLDGRRFLVSNKYIDLLKVINGNIVSDLYEKFPLYKHGEIDTLIDLLVKKGILVFKDNYEIFNVSIIENEIISEDAMSFPRTVYWESTQICNFKCIHCYSESNIKGFEGIELNTAKKLVDEMVNNGVEFFNIGGGEPLMYKHIFEVINYCSLKGLKIELTTNGSLLTDLNIKKLKHCGLKFIQVSLDGATKTSFETMRPGSNFELIKENIRKLVENDFVVSINTVLTKINHLEIIDIINLSQDLGASFYKVSPLMETGRGCDNKLDIQLTLKELRLVYENIFKYQEKNQNPKFNIIVNKNVLNPSIKNIDWMPECHYGCPAGRSTCGIDSYGNVYPCSYMNHEDLVCGNISNKPLLEIWKDSKIMNEIRKIDKIDGKCNSCKHLETCRGGCRATAYLRYNKLDASDPLCVAHL
nr:radical SAM protein [Candidatus Gracilibacteria bacterium]